MLKMKYYLGTMKETKNPIVKIYSLIEHFNIKKIERI